MSGHARSTRFSRKGFASVLALGCALSCVFAAAGPIQAQVGPSPSIESSFLWDGVEAGVIAGFEANRLDRATGSDESTRSFDGGVFLGYNARVDDVVVGLETDIARAGDAAIEFGADSRIEQVWNATVRGRLGRTFGNMMIYGTGGFAFTEIEAQNANRFDATVYPGWVIGGGIEQALSTLTTARFEYHYTDYDLSSGFASDLEGAPDRLGGHAFRAGIGFQF